MSLNDEELRQYDGTLNEIWASLLTDVNAIMKELGLTEECEAMVFGEDPWCVAKGSGNGEIGAINRWRKGRKRGSKERKKERKERQGMKESTLHRLDLSTYQPPGRKRSFTGWWTGHHIMTTA